MAQSEFDRKLLKMKKEKFREVVYRTCKTRGLPIPKINFSGCPSETGEQLAHYHPDSNKICVSEFQLNKQNFDDIENTASHEVTHILVLDHGPDFHQEHADIKTKSWVPPPGVSIVRETQLTIRETHEEKEDKVRCNYHLCRKKTKLMQCGYCNGFYCAEHIKPSEPQVAKVGESIRDSVGSHPCFGYSRFLEQKAKNEEVDYNEALTKLTSSRQYDSRSSAYERTYAPPETSYSEVKEAHSNKDDNANNNFTQTEPKKQEQKSSPSIDRKSFNINLDFLDEFRFWAEDRKRPFYSLRRHQFLVDSLIFSILVILALILYNNISYFNSMQLSFIMLGSLALLIVVIYALKYVYRILKNIKYAILGLNNISKVSILVILLFLLAIMYSNQEKIPEMLNETNISINMSHFYPFNISINLSAGNNGTGSNLFGIRYGSQQDCKEAFSYLNGIRGHYGRDDLAWDERVYALAVFRSHDMYERGYFDHITPEGMCSEDFKEEFNISEVGAFAENIGGMTYDAYTGEPVSSCKEAVDSWMGSRGHKYAMLYPYRDYKKAAIGCYKHICTFLVLTTEPFQCVHGEDGLNYWETVPIQPGEVN